MTNNRCASTSTHAPRTSSTASRRGAKKTISAAVNAVAVSSNLDFLIDRFHAVKPFHNLYCLKNFILSVSQHERRKRVQRDSYSKKGVFMVCNNR